MAWEHQCNNKRNWVCVELGKSKKKIEHITAAAAKIIFMTAITVQSLKRNVYIQIEYYDTMK